MYSVYPEYESFTSVEILLTVDGKAGRTFSISKYGEHLQSLTIKEGTVGNGPQLSNPDIGGGVSSGTVSLYDEDNAIFYSLLESKTRGGDQLLNTLDITLKTYTGIRKYSQCKINKWSCNFQGGVPTINLEWQSIGSDSQPAQANPEQPSFNPTIAKSLLVDEGFDSFSDFKQKTQSVFNNTLRFCYTDTKVVRESLKEIPDSGKIIFFSGEESSEGVIYIPDSFLSEENNKKYRMKLQITNDASSFLMSVMNEFCNVAKLHTSGDDQQLQWKYLNGNTVFIYSYKNRGSLSIPEPQGTVDILDNTVFVYNSGYSQGSLYKTPQGDKKVFVIDSISSNFDFGNIIITNLTDDNNGICPNGNLVLTSRGTLMIPQSVPGDVAANIRKIEGFNLTNNFKVSITVYNFIHFYVMGDTHVHLLVFDHLGNVHPITGDMRVEGYQYEINDGVVKANVTLVPVLENAQTTFLGDNSYPTISEFEVNEPVPPTTSSPQYAEGKADIKIDGSMVSNPKPQGEPPNFLGIQVKEIAGAEFFHGDPFNIKRPPRWVVVHYSASHSDNAESETKMFARWYRTTQENKEARNAWEAQLAKVDSKDVKSWKKEHPAPVVYSPVSTHFFCDHRGVYKVVDEKYPAWHATSETRQPYKKEWSNKQIYTEAVTKGTEISYARSAVWRFDVPSNNKLIWGGLNGKSIPDSQGNETNPFKSYGKTIGGNLNSFGVDLCSNKKGTDKRKDVDATDWYVKPETEENCAKVVAYLCYKWDIPPARVLRHCDCTGKPCLPVYKTEVFTPYGFIPLSEIKVGDLVYQYNKDTGLLEETNVLATVKPYVATVCKNREYESTLNHRTLYRDVSGKVYVEYFGDLIHRLNKESLYLYTTTDCKTFYPTYKLSSECYLYNDVVSCIEVQSSYIVIRQNNTIFITGNCPRPMVAMPSDADMGNELKWKILRDKNTRAVIRPEQYNVGGNIYDYSYTYDPTKHILDLEEDKQPADRTSFLGKVAGYIDVLREQNYPYAYRENK